MEDTGQSRAPGAALWSRWFFEWASLAPIWVGSLLAASLLAAFFGFEFASGRMERFVPGDTTGRITRGLAVLLVLIAYLPTAQIYLARWSRRHVDSLRPLLGGGEDLVFRDVYRQRSSRLAGAAGSVAFVTLFLLVPIDADVYRRIEYWTPESAVPWLLLPVTGWMVARLAHALIFDALFVSHLAADLRRIDLVDTGPLAPFVQQGLRSALLILLFLGIGLTGLPGQSEVMTTALLNIVAMLAVAVTALVLPVTGVRARIRAEKKTQLATLRERINADREAVLHGGPGADSATSRLPGILALESRLESVREWPFDLPSLLRFALYVALGLGSWLGAATVERMLDVALD